MQAMPRPAPRVAPATSATFPSSGRSVMGTSGLDAQALPSNHRARQGGGREAAVPDVKAKLASRSGEKAGGGSMAGAWIRARRELGLFALLAAVPALAIAGLYQ